MASEDSAREAARQLNVGDALGYLDAVKVQFQDKPDVYNHFLDIMKDFKSQAIDTPGVIERVSLLFHESPVLIQGFNTFLPQGYRIDLSTDSSHLVVTTPLGTTMQSTNFAGSRPVPYHHPQFAYEQGQQSPGVPATNAAATVLGGLSSSNVEKTADGVQFNHAIQYLNKIKDRFADDPHTYKQFLEILQNYQKEQRHLHDSQVFNQVKALFKDAPDLLDEFKAFLPSIGMGGADQWQPENPNDKPQRKAAAAQKRKRPTEKEPPPPPPPKAAPARSKKPKQGHKADTEPSYSPYNAPRSPLPQAHMPPPPHPIITHTPTSTDKLQFFDRAKRALDRELYEEFLKLLNLFTLEIIPAKVLVEKAETFFADRELWREFKDLVLGEQKRHVKSGPPGSLRSGPGYSEALMASLVDHGQGPSYRRLPDSEIRLACSGRDQLGRSVLNDAWVSHPTWASEDVGFMTLKKSQFEEAVLKTEEERHEYHVQLEALSRTIALLDPLASRLEDMSPEERAAWRLDSTFGGKSKSVYHRVLRKIYGKEAGNEIIESLQTSPSAAVPVVVNRLKEKYEEWRRAQREWNRTWREVDAKNFYKALDHQGITFKGTDKKAITAKHFVGDIEAIKTTREEENGLGFEGRWELEYAFDDVEVLQDALKLVYSFLDHQVQYDSSERHSFERFLRLFVPLLGSYNLETFNAGCGPTEVSLDEDDSNGEDRTPNGYAPSNQDAESSVFRRRLSKRAKGKQKSKSPEPVEEDMEDVWVRLVPVTGNMVPEDNGIDLRSNEEECLPFFANTTYYTLLRLIQLLYSRLLMCKEIGREQATDNHGSIQSNIIAVELGLEDPNGPFAVLSQAMTGCSPGTNVMYQYLLSGWEKVFENELEQGVLEEHLRWFFRNQAHQVYTLDKVIVAVIKQVQSILSETKGQELGTLLRETRQVEGGLSNQDIIRYRREAERHVGPDDLLYRVEWMPTTKRMRIKLMGPQDASKSLSKSSKVTRWRDYVDGFTMRYPTEHLPMKRQRSVFLRRNLNEDLTPPFTRNGMRIWVSYGTYRVFYGAGGEDILYRGERGRGKGKVEVVGGDILSLGT